MASQHQSQETGAPGKTGASPVSARPAITRALMAETGLDEAILRRMVEQFYMRARADALLGPVFEDHIHDWGAHFDRMVDFWSSVALMTGRYHGTPMAAHSPLRLTAGHFERWQALFRKTVCETCPQEGAARLISQAERIGRVLARGALPPRPGAKVAKLAPHPSDLSGKGTDHDRNAPAP